MAFAQAYKIQGGGGSINSRTVLRTDRPLSANSITSKSLTTVSGLASAPQRTKSSNSPSTNTSSSNAAPSNRRHSNGSSKCHDGGGKLEIISFFRTSLGSSTLPLNDLP